MKAALIGLCIASLLMGKQKDEKQKAFLEQDVKNGINEMIQLLEAGEHRKFLNLHLSPRTRLYLKRHKTYDDAVKEFTERKAPALIDALKKARDMNPSVNPRWSTAEFREDPYSKPLVLIRSKKRWYVFN